MKISQLTFTSLTVIIGLAFSAGTAQSQEHKSPVDTVPGVTDATKSLVEKLVEGFEFENFNLSKDPLPAGFKGNSPAAISSALQANFKPKDEFETSAEYQTRIKGSESGTLYGNVKVGALVSFVVPVTSVYDADKSSLKMEVQVIDSILDTPPSILLADYTRTDYYDGENMFGKSVAVKKIRGVRIKANFLNPSEYKIVKQNRLGYLDVDDIRVSIPLDREEARAQKQNIQALLVAYVKSPYLFYDKVAHLPTVREPIDMDADDYFVGLQIQEVWFFNSTTGKVYTQLVPKRKGGR